MEYQLVMKTTRALSTYNDKNSESLPENIHEEIVNVVTKYNKQFLDNHPEKIGLVTKVTLHSI